VRPHKPLELPDYQKLFSSAISHVHSAWSKRKL
jgi:hypothetical protein